MRRMWAKQAICFDCWLKKKDYLRINVFSNLVVVEQEEYSHTLQKKAIEEATNKLIKKTAGQTRPDLTFRTSTLAPIIHHTTWWIGVMTK